MLRLNLTPNVRGVGIIGRIHLKGPIQIDLPGRDTIGHCYLLSEISWMVQHSPKIWYKSTSSQTQIGKAQWWA